MIRPGSDITWRHWGTALAILLLLTVIVPIVARFY